MATSLFGATNPSQSGQPAGLGLFGQPSQSKPPGTSLFGQTPTAGSQQPAGVSG